MALARTFLGLNAGFSLLCGASLLLAGGGLAAQMFAEPAGWQAPVFLALGIGLLLFAFDLVLLATDRFVTKGKVMLIVLADLGWILGSVALLMLLGGLFTSVGAWIVSGVAVTVAFVAIGQWIGAGAIEMPASRAKVTSSGGSLVATVERDVDAPASVAWQVMTDHPAYADVANNLSKVEMVEGDGLGMVRRCYGPKGENWTETCDLYEEGRSFGFTIHTDAPDYPYPLSQVQGRWSVVPKGEGARFDIHIRAVPKGGLFSRTLFVLVANRQFKAVLVDLADGWAERMEREARK